MLNWCRALFHLAPLAHFALRSESCLVIHCAITYMWQRSRFFFGSYKIIGRAGWLSLSPQSQRSRSHPLTLCARADHSFLFSMAHNRTQSSLPVQPFSTALAAQRKYSNKITKIKFCFFCSLLVPHEHTGKATKQTNQLKWRRKSEQTERSDHQLIHSVSDISICVWSRNGWKFNCENRLFR